MKAFTYLLAVLICAGSFTPELFAVKGGKRNSFKALDSQSTPGQQEQKNQEQLHEEKTVLPEDINPNEDWDSKQEIKKETPPTENPSFEYEEFQQKEELKPDANNNNNQPSEANPIAQDKKVPTPKSSPKIEKVEGQTLKQVVDEMVKPSSPSVNIKNEIKEAVCRLYNVPKDNNGAFFIMPFEKAPSKICDTQFTRKHYCQYVEDAFTIEGFEKNDEQKTEIIINALANAFALRSLYPDEENSKKQVTLWKKRIDEVKSAELKQKIKESFGAIINYDSDGESFCTKDKDGFVTLKQKPDTFYAKYRTANDLRQTDNLNDATYQAEIKTIKNRKKELDSKINELQKQIDNLTLQKEQQKQQFNKLQEFDKASLISIDYLKAIEKEKYSQIVHTGQLLVAENCNIDAQLDILNKQLKNSSLEKEKRAETLLTIDKIQKKKEANLVSIKEIKSQEAKAQKRNPELKTFGEIKLPEVKSSGWGLGWLTSSDGK